MSTLKGFPATYLAKIEPKIHPALNFLEFGSFKFELSGVPVPAYRWKPSVRVVPESAKETVIALQRSTEVWSGTGHPPANITSCFFAQDGSRSVRSSTGGTGSPLADDRKELIVASSIVIFV
jgi:hypothetical protein